MSQVAGLYFDPLDANAPAQRPRNATRYTFDEEWRHHVINNCWEVLSHDSKHWLDDSLQWRRRTIYAGHDEADARSLANYEIRQGRTAVLYKLGKPVARGGPGALEARPRQRVRRRQQTTRRRST